MAKYSVCCVRYVQLWWCWYCLSVGSGTVCKRFVWCKLFSCLSIFYECFRYRKDQMHNLMYVWFFYIHIHCCVIEFKQRLGSIFLVFVFDIHVRCLLTPSTLGIFITRTGIVQLVIRNRKLVRWCCWLFSCQAEGKNNPTVGCVRFCYFLLLVFRVCVASSDRWKLCLWLDTTVFYPLVRASVYVSELKERVAVVFGAFDKDEDLSHCLLFCLQDMVSRWGDGRLLFY